MASRCHSCSLERFEFETDYQEECPLAESEDNFSGGGVGLNFHAGTVVAQKPQLRTSVTCRSFRSPSMWKEPWFLTLGPTLGAHKPSHLAHNLA